MLAALLFGLGGVCAAEEVLPLYTEGALAAEERGRLQREIPAQVVAARKRLAETETRLSSLFKGHEETMQAVRVAKRLEIARRLSDFAVNEHARGDVSALASAERALYDLAAFEQYFADEEKLWKNYPHPPTPTSTSTSNLQPHRFDLVRDFGAVPDGKTPVDAAWQKAQDAIRALKGQPSILAIPAGDYLFAEKKVVPAFTCVYSGEYCRDANVRHAQAPVFALENCIVSGEKPGSVRFRFGVFASQGLRLVNCRNVTVCNIEVAYEKTPFLQGRILAVSPATATCDVEVDAGTLTPDDAAFTEKGASDGMLCCSAFTSAGDLDRQAAFMFYARKFSSLGGRRYRLSFDNSQKYYQHGNLKVGETLVLPARNNYYHAASMAYCDFCNFEGVWVRNARAAAFSVHRGRASTFDRCRVFPAEGRVLSANADGLINSCGTCLLRSEIRNQSDDGFNSMSRGEFINGTAGSDALLHGRIGRGTAGEMFLAVDPETGRYRGNLFAKAAGSVVPWRKGGSWKTVFTRPVPADIATYDSLGLGLISRERQGRAAMNLERLKKEPDHLYAPSADGVGTVVCDCTIRNMRGSGLVIQSANALLENNVFSNIWRAVNLGGLVKYKEGPPPYNVVVRGNRAFDVESGFTTGYQVQNGGWAKCAPIRGCLFENNLVDGATFEAYGLRNIGFSRLVGNKALQARKALRTHVTEGLSWGEKDAPMVDWGLRFANGKFLVSEGRPCVTNGSMRVWTMPEATVTLRRAEGASFTDLVVEVTPHLADLLEVDAPYAVRFAAKEGTRLVMPMNCQFGPGAAFNERFFQQRGKAYDPGLAFMDYAHLTTAEGDSLALFGVQGRPYLNASPVCGGDDRGGWVRHRYLPYVRKGETRILPPVRLLKGVGNRAAISHYATANGLVRTLADKMPKDKIDRLSRAPLLLLSNSRATECAKIVPELPKPVLFHTASYLAGGFDKQYPDQLPPNEERFGTSAEFRSLINALHAHGHFFMPYTNPTWWCDNPPGPSFKAFGTAPACVHRDGRLWHEEYGPGNTGYCVSQWHPEVKRANRRILEAFVRDFPSDILFQDQCGNRNNPCDFNSSAPSPDAYVEGLLRMLDEHVAKIPLGTEDAWDRVANIETALFGACWRLVATPEEGPFHSRKFRHLHSPETWTIEPIALYLMHDRALFWMHDLGQFVENRRILAWMAALGYNLSFRLSADAWANDPAKRAWFETLADLQKNVFSRLAGQPLLAYRHEQGEGPLDDGFVVAQFGEVAVKVNLGDKPRPVDGEQLEPYGWRIGEARSSNLLPSLPSSSPSLSPSTSSSIALLRMAEPLDPAWTRTPPAKWGEALRALAKARGFSYREITTPEDLVAMLKRGPSACAAIVNPYGEHIPLVGPNAWPETARALLAFVRQGGWWFETGGYSFHTPVWREKGTWRRKAIAEAGPRALGFHVVLGALSEPPGKLVLAGEAKGEAMVNRALSELPTEAVVPLVRDWRGRIWFGYHPQGRGRFYRVGGAYPPFETLWSQMALELKGSSKNQSPLYAPREM